MFLRSLLRRGAAGGGIRAPAARLDPPASLASLLLASRSYAKAKGGGKPAASTSNRGKIRVKDPKGVASEDASASGESSASTGGADELDAEFEMPTDPLPPSYDPALDVGPGGRPLFAFTDTFASFSHRGANAYVDFTYKPILLSSPFSSRVDPNAVICLVMFRCVRFVCQIQDHDLKR
jgi:small subunit ribosomal protein S29